ncbi:hypothetical protein AAFC00_001271 [Neodothiora populina]|uniref:UDP-glucose:glycoprotein glucosyltransferase n=1 Tax=Neodothiora populina TaxID=2781224 RepID=A0ABR3PNP9_9PEZI
MILNRAPLLALLGSCTVGVYASPAINVALHASFDSAPFLVELLETAADENATSYFPLLDRIAEGHFDHVKTDADLYDLFLHTLQDDGHIADAVSLSSFQFALSIHSTAPRIEAHYQFYNTSVLPSIQNGEGDGCESWMHFNGRQYCTPDLAATSGAAVKEGDLSDLPFDRILGDSASKTPSILYADLMSPQFRRFHQTVSATAKAGKTSYRVRYKPSSAAPRLPLSVSGYGVELALKRTDYIVIDDRQSENDEATEETVAPEATLKDTEVADLKPLSASELRGLDLKAASFVMASADPLDTLHRLVQDFPKHSQAMAANNISVDFKKEHSSNRDIFLPPGFNILWINGVQVLARDFDAYFVLELLRKERKLIGSAGELGLSGNEAIQLLSHPSIAQEASQQEPQRYNWQDELEGGNVIMWLNDIEHDKRYAEWTSVVRAFLQRTFPGQLPPVRKEAHTLILPIDFADHKDVQLVVENLQNFVVRKVPIRFGLVPRTDSDASSAQAQIVYHLLRTYGPSAVMDYLEKISLKHGRKALAPAQAVFDGSVKDRKLRKDRKALSMEQVLQNEESQGQLASAQKYLQRLGATGSAPPYFANGVTIQRTDDWLQEMSNRVTLDSRVIQKAVYEEVIGDDDYVPSLFLTGSSSRRNPVIIPENEADIRHVSLSEIYAAAGEFLGQLKSIPANENTIESELAHMIVVSDLDSDAGKNLVSQALAFRKEYDNVELIFVHSPTANAESVGFSEDLYQHLSGAADVSIESIEHLLAKTGEHEQSDTARTQSSWTAAAPLLEIANIKPGDSTILLNGRVVGPLPADVEFTSEAFDTLFAYERKKHLIPAAAAIQELGLESRTNTPLAFAKLTNLIALSSSSDVPEGVFDSVPPARTAVFEKWSSDFTAIEIGDISTASIQVVASIDPASEVAQRWVPIIKVLTEMQGIHTRIFVNPKDRLEELPVKRFYRHVLESKPSFDEAGSLKALAAHFDGLPADALLTMAMDVPPSWVVAPIDSIHDLDNIKLSSVKDGADINAIYGLQYILIEGHSRDVTVGSAPRGAQLVLGTAKNPHSADTIIMSNLGYFQFKANPGYYNLTLQQGRSEEIFHIDSVGAQEQKGEPTTQIALTTFRGNTLFPMLSRKPGMEDEDVLEATKTAVDEVARKTDALLSKVGLGNVKSGDLLSKAQKLGNNLLSGKYSSTTDVQTLPHADINIFSVASGHLYERMLNIMMLSVMKHTSHTVKFWFIEQFLSPSFKAFLPTLAEEYGFRYEMVTYKWPHWLRSQKEKQREIWGYKILFLDVLFPLDLDKVIFVDADQIVRTDMYELVQYDLKGAPYGFTPMCDSRTEMEGFRFWKQGYWKNFLRGLPYHISALYVVDLVRFRQIAAGDRLRQQYHQLSADPASLSNLDQDLPNHMQHVLPIHSLPQEWLWCETWCSDESLGVARTIDLCNNPLTKEPKLDRARRQVPEWGIYDAEIAEVAKRKALENLAVVGGAGQGASLQAEMQKKDAEEAAAAAAKAKSAHDEL